MMWDNIKKQIENGNYAYARELLDREKLSLKKYNDIFAILEASVCRAEGDIEGMFDAIARGLSDNPVNYELYYMLGHFYYNNPNQAFLCFQNALFYCNAQKDRDIIQKEMDDLTQLYKITVKNSVIVIVSYNSCYLLKKNIESIRNTLMEGTYRIVVVDNASEDGAAEWLEKQRDIILIKNQENRGFSCACNQGVKIAQATEWGQDDIFLLNNDTRLALNSLFWLRMGLYENEKTGAVGCYSNYAGNGQQLDIMFSLPGEYLDYGAKCNIPLKRPYEERVRLSGFAMLVSRAVWDAVGGMDEQFTPGYFEDDDFCMQILKRGYKIVLCKNSFIYHAGSQSFSQKDNVNELLLEHHRLFISKYGFDILSYAVSNGDWLEGISFLEEDEFSVLQIGSGLGADLKLLHSCYPKSHVVGIEPDAALYDIAKGTEAIFKSAVDLSTFFSFPIFDLLIIDPQIYKQLSENAKKIIAGLCKKGCILLTKK